MAFKLARAMNKKYHFYGCLKKMKIFELTVYETISTLPSLVHKNSCNLFTLTLTQFCRHHWDVTSMTTDQRRSQYPCFYVFATMEVLNES